MRQFKIGKCFPLFLIWLILTNDGYAQAEYPLNTPPPSQFKLFFSPVIYNNVKLTNVGKEILKSRRSFSGVIGVGLYQQVYKGWGVNIMGEMTVVPRNLLIPHELQFDTSTMVADWRGNFTEVNEYAYLHFTYNLALSVQKSFHITTSRFCTIEVGASLNRLVAFPYEDSVRISVQSNNASSTRLFYYGMSNYYRRTFPAYFFKAGLLKVNSKLNSIQWKLVGNYSPHEIGKGSYRFYQTPYESSGTAELGLNYAGIEFCYGITRFKKRMRAQWRIL